MANAQQDAWLKQVLGVDAAASPGSGGDADGDLAGKKAALAKLGKVWAAAEAKVRKDLATLGSHVEESYADDDDGPTAMGVFQKHLDTILGVFDSTLAADLAAAASAKSAEELTELSHRLGDAAASMTASLQSDPVIAAIDDNPYTPVSVVKTCTSVFSAIAGHV